MLQCNKLKSSWKMRKKILYLVTSSGWGGAERYVSVLASSARHAFEVHVLAGNSSPSEKLFESLPEGVVYGKLPRFRREISPLNDLRAAHALAKYIDKHAIDLVHGNSSKSALVVTLAVLQCKREPKVVYTAHGWGFLEKSSWFFRALILAAEKFASGKRDATIVLSESEYEEALHKELSASEKLHVIPHGIDAGEIAFLERSEARRHLGAAGTVIGTIANAYPPKALDLLILAFERIAPAIANAQLVIIGDGPDMPRLRELRNSSSMKDRIHLRGHLDDAASYLKAFDLFVLSSTKEGLPWSILEASLAGCAIIATRVGAIPELIEDGRTGQLVYPGNAEALAEAMRKVLNDGHLLMRLKNGAPEIAELHSSSRMTERTLNIYRSLLEPVG